MATLIVRSFDTLQDYRTIWQAMQAFTTSRQPDTPDELWLLEHHPVYTQGQAGKAEHVLQPGDIPVVQTDRGGQVTWHGPGQLMIYTLLDTRRLGLGPRALVSRIEQALIAVLAQLAISAYARAEAPGVYVQVDGREAKLAALGLRFRQQGCYHGAALNIDCELAGFAGINPCGYPGLPVARLADLLTVVPDRAGLEQRVTGEMAAALDYANIERIYS